jgi:hypothetical protein
LELQVRKRKEDKGGVFETLEHTLSLLFSFGILLAIELLATTWFATGFFCIDGDAVNTQS